MSQNERLGVVGTKWSLDTVSLNLYKKGGGGELCKAETRH
jgi:hypothetical protein